MSNLNLFDRAFLTLMLMWILSEVATGTKVDIAGIFTIMYLFVPELAALFNELRRIDNRR